MMFNKRAMAALMAAGLVISGTASHEARADFFVDENGNPITEDASAFSDEYAESYEDYSGYTEEAADFGSGYSDAAQEDLFSLIEEEQSGDAAEEHKDGASNDAVSQYEAWLLSLGDYAVYYNEGKLPNSKIYDHDGQLLYDPEHPEESVLKEYEGVIEKEDSAAAQAESVAESTESEKNAEEAAADTAEEPAEKEEETVEAAEEEPAEAAEESAETEAPAEEAEASAVVAEAPAEVVEESAEEAEVTEAPAEVVEESAEATEAPEEAAEEPAEVSEEPAEAAEDEAVFEGELKTSGVVLLVGASSDAKLVEDLITDETEVTETEEEPDLEAGSNDASYATSGASELVGDTSKVYTPSSGSSSSGKTTAKTETDTEEESDRPSSSEEAYTKQVGDESGDEEEAGDEADTDEEAAEDETEEVTDEEEEAEDAESDSEKDTDHSSGGNIKGKSPSTADASPILPYTAASVMSFAAGIWAALGFGRKKEDQ